MSDFEGTPRVPLRFAVDPASGEYRRAEPWDSKAGGAPPYRTAGAGWPMRRRADGAAEPLGFAAQLNLGRIHEECRARGAALPLDGLLPTHGILQFFLPLEEGWGYRGRVGAVAWFPEVVEDRTRLDEPLVAVVRGPSVLDEAALFEREDPSPVPRRRAAARSGGRRPFLACTSDSWRWSPLTQPEWPFALELAMPEPGGSGQDGNRLDESQPDGSLQAGSQQGASRPGGIQLGGEPRFTQDDPRPEGSSLVLLLQLDSSDEPLSIGDGGVLSFFIEPAALAARDFSQTWMTWDAY